MYKGISVDKTFNQSTNSSSSCLHEMINFIVSTINDHYDLNMQNNFEVYIEVQNTLIDTIHRGNRQ